MGVDRRGLIGGAVSTLAAATGAGGVAVAFGQDEALRVEVDFHGWSGLEAWTRSLRPDLPVWWRRINDALGGPAPAVTTIRLDFFQIEPPGIAAVARGDRVLINAPYVLAHIDNADMRRIVAHELTHVAQAYPRGARPAWLSEGIADYVRYYVLFPDDPGRAFDPAGPDWRSGYAPAAGLLAWADSQWPGAVAAVNAAMRRGEDGAAALARATGASPAVLWRSYLETRPDAASAEKRRAYEAGLQAGAKP